MANCELFPVTCFDRRLGFFLVLMMRLRVQLHSRKLFKRGEIQMLQNRHSVLPPVCIVLSR